MEQKKEAKRERVLLLGASLGDGSLKDTDEVTMKELEELCETAEAEVVGIILQNIKSVDPRTYIGSGKVQEAREFIDQNEVTLAVFDSELSGSMTRNLEEALGITVIDRSRLILDIFAMRAKTREGKCQVELAQLKYILPRLSGLGHSLSRLGGGIGTRGPGETKLESDRRHIRRRIDHLAEELLEIEKHRDNLRKKRTEDSVPVIALVGYTNVGKSSLLNLLTQENSAYVENKLFATLDPLIRKIRLNGQTDVLLTDTVGFIRKLPHHLIEAFKSTLEEVKYADLILHVADASTSEVEENIQVVEGILKDLGAEAKPQVMVFNKCDKRFPPDYLVGQGAVCISVKEHLNIDALNTRIEKALFENKHRLVVQIPYHQGKLLGMLYENATVLSEESLEDGFLISVVADEEIYQKIKEFEVKDEL